MNWFLRDEFTTTLPAGSVNGSLSDSGAVRTVRDVESKIALSAGWAEFTSQATAVYTEQDLVFSTPVITRAIGVAVFNKFRCTVDGLFYPLALVTSQTPDWNNNIEAAFQRSPTALSLRTYNNGVAGPIVATFVADGTLYCLGLVADGAAGYKYYIKGGAFINWTLLFRSVTGATTSLYAAMAGYSAAFGGDFVRVALTVTNGPLLSDTFSGTFGTPDVIGGAWNSVGTWATAGGVVANTPVVIDTGLIANPSIEAAMPTVNGVAINYMSRCTIAQSAEQAKTGTKSIKLSGNGASGAGEFYYIWYQNALGLTNGKFYRQRTYLFFPSGQNAVFTSVKTTMKTGGVLSISELITTKDVWTESLITFRQNYNAADEIKLGASSNSVTPNSAGLYFYADDLALELLPISTLITNQALSTTDVLAEEVISAYTLGTQVGIVQSDRSFAAKAAATAAAGQTVLSLKEVTGVSGVGLAVTDGITVNGVVYTIASVTGGSNVAYNDVTKTQTITLGANLGTEVLTDAKVGLDWASWNGSLIYFDGAGNIKLDEVLAGVFTSRGSTTTAFSANARLIVRKIGAEYRIFYNEALIGTAISTVAVGAMVGTYWGMFSTLEANKISNFVVYDTGNVTNAYSTLDKYSRD